MKDNGLRAIKHAVRRLRWQLWSGIGLSPGITLLLVHHLGWLPTCALVLLWLWVTAGTSLPLLAVFRFVSSPPYTRGGVRAVVIAAVPGTVMLLGFCVLLLVIRAQRPGLIFGVVVAACWLVSNGIFYFALTRVTARAESGEPGASATPLPKAVLRRWTFFAAPSLFLMVGSLFAWMGHMVSPTTAVVIGGGSLLTVSVSATWMSIRHALRHAGPRR